MSEMKASHVAYGGLEEGLALTRSRLFVFFSDMKHNHAQLKREKHRVHGCTSAVRDMQVQRDLAETASDFK